MAVLVEAISVVVRRDSIDRCFNGGWQGFISCVPNATLCYDAELARVGFLNPDAVGKFLDTLKTGGLTFLRDDKCIDIAVVDQLQGPTRPCEWIECARIPFGNTGGKVSICWLFDEPRVAAGIHLKSLQMKFVTPAGWVFERSISDKSTFVPAEEVASRLKYLRTEKSGADVFLDSSTGREVFT